ncbi:MAG: DUF4846 domain-containing protein [Ferruginibacter sp.]
MPTKIIYVLLLLFYFSCTGNSSSGNDKNTFTDRKITEEKNGNPYKNISEIPVPEGFQRNVPEKSSFAYWLRNISLKKDRTVYKYDGSLKANQSAQFAVLDISVGKEDLQQCADAVMRLRAEYLYSKQAYDSILFIDNEGGHYQFGKPYDRSHFDQYLQKVFGMCGSASLSKQLNAVNFSSIASGDVIIRGGFPGHAVMVVDVAQNAAGKKIYLIAQSYMPAQDIHVLVNPVAKNISPWYEVNDEKLIITPEYLFYNNELKRW